MNASLHDPLKRARGLGSAKNGVHHFVVQRLTALALIPLGIWFFILVLRMLHADYATAYALIAQPFNALLMILFVVAMFWHAQLGLQVVIEDYVHRMSVALPLQVSVRFLCVLGAFASVLAIVRIALGS